MQDAMKHLQPILAVHKFIRVSDPDCQIYVNLEVETKGAAYYCVTIRPCAKTWVCKGTHLPYVRDMRSASPSGKFAVEIDHTERKVIFAPDDFILSHDLRGHGIGGHVLSMLIAWAQNSASEQLGSEHYRVVPRKLGPEDADDDNRLRRNSFYKNRNFQFKWDFEDKIGHIYADCLSQLKVVLHPERIADVTCDDFFRILSDRCDDQRAHTHSLSELNRLTARSDKLRSLENNILLRHFIKR